MLGEHNYCSYELDRAKVGRRIESKDANIGMVVTPDIAVADRNETQSYAGFLIESSLELASIKRNCPHVWFSREVSPDLLGESTASAVAPANCSDLIDCLRRELPIAERAFSQALIEIRLIYDGLGDGLMIDFGRLRQIVAELSASLRRCPGSLLLLSQCKNVADYLYEHAVRVSIYSILLGQRVGMSEPELEELGLAAMLHDVGKIMIPANILDKVGELNSAEYAVVKVHPLEGRKILVKQSQVPESVIDVVMQHHEHMDGNGYPAGLNGSQISPLARIVAIMDVFDAMTSDRAYSRSRPTSDTLEILQRCKGTQFDAGLVDLFCAVIGDLPVGHVARLSNGDQGIILGADLGNRLYQHVLCLGEIRNNGADAQNVVSDHAVRKVFAWPLSSKDEVFVESVESTSNNELNLIEYIERFADLK